MKNNKLLQEQNPLKNTWSGCSTLWDYPDNFHLQQLSLDLRQNSGICPDTQQAEFLIESAMKPRTPTNETTRQT